CCVEDNACGSCCSSRKCCILDRLMGRLGGNNGCGCCEEPSCCAEPSCGVAHGCGCGNGHSAPADEAAPAPAPAPVEAKDARIRQIPPRPMADPNAAVGRQRDVVRTSFIR